MKKMLCAAALLLPTLVLGGIVMQRLSELETAPVVRLPIVGYDPVDLLHGHYIRLRFDSRVLSNNPGNYALKNGDYCVCFIPSAAAKNEPVGRFVECKTKEKPQCEHWATKGAFFGAAQKYFVDERYAMQLDKIVREATPRLGRDQTNSEPSRVTVDVAISKSGALQLKMLYIDNKPWREVVAGAP